MAQIANLTIKISAQIAELQKSFDDAFGTVAKFERQFAGLASSIEARQQDIKKAFSSFAGDNIIREANILTEAITKVGGASKLTASEQQRANATLTEAIAKYKVLGETAPKALQDLAQATTKIPPIVPPEVPKSLFAGIAEQAAGVATGMLTATAAIGAVTGAFDLAKSAIGGAFDVLAGTVTKTSALGDELFALSQKTGLSVESLSAFKFVAAQTNTSLDSISSAVFKMEANLGAGSKKTTDAVAAIGLSLKDLRGEDPAQAFADVIAKIGELPNASARAAAGVAIIGKSFKEVAQLAQEDLPGLIGQSKELGLVMSTETAVAADRFHDALGVLKGGVEGLGLQIGAKLLPAVVAFTEVFGGIFLDAIKAAVGSTKGLGEGFDTFVVQVGVAAARFLEILAKMVEGIGEWAVETSKQLVAETKAFLDIAPSIIAVGRVLDLAFSGGQSSTAFDALEKNLAGLKGSLQSIGDGSAAVGAKISAVAKGIADAAKGTQATFEFTFQGILQQVSDDAEKMRKRLAAIGDGGVAGAKGASDAFSSFGKQLATLTAQIDRAALEGTPLTEQIRLFGREASDAASKAKAFGQNVEGSVLLVAEGFERAQLDTLLDKTARSIDLTGAKLKEFFALGSQFQATPLGSGTVFDKLNDGVIKMGAELAKKTNAKLAEGAHEATDSVIASISPIHDAFEALGKQLPDLLFGALKNGGGVGQILLATATGVGSAFGQVFQKALDASIKSGIPLTTRQNAVGLAAVAAQTFVSSFSVGQSSGNKTKGTLAGAGAGAVAGLPFAAATGGLSIAVGAGIGALGGFFGGRAADKQAQAALEANKQALVQQFGGMTALNALAQKLDVNIQAAFDAKKPAAFQAAVDQLNTAIDAENKRVSGLSQALEAVNSRTATFAKQFTPLVEAKTSATQSGDTSGAAAASQKIQEAAQRTQPEFERLGIFVKATFAAMVKDSGDAVAAITSLAPSFQVLKDGVSDFGLTSTAVIDGLLGSFDLVNSEITGPFIQNVQSSGQILKGLGDSLDADTFQALATDIGQSLQEVANRGGDISKALALSQPVLQDLWEQQQKFGGVTDQTTQSILDQAAQQGLVGEAMKGVNDKILDVLLAIGKVLGADIPAGLAGLAAPADAAGAAVTASLGGAFADVAGTIDPTIGKSLRDIAIPAGEAGESMRRALATQAAEAAGDISTKIGGSLTALAIPAGAGANDMRETFASSTADVAGGIATRIGGSLTGLSTTAKTAASDIGLELGKIRVPPISLPVAVKVGDIPSVSIPVRFDWGPGGRPDGIPTQDIPAMANGGIVRKRTLAIIGEAGPEAVIPLNRANFAPAAQSGGTTVLELDGQRVGEILLPHIAREAQRYGLVPR